MDTSNFAENLNDGSVNVSISQVIQSKASTNPSTKRTIDNTKNYKSNTMNQDAIKLQK